PRRLRFPLPANFACDCLENTTPPERVRDQQAPLHRLRTTSRFPRQARIPTAIGLRLDLPQSTPRGQASGTNSRHLATIPLVETPVGYVGPESCIASEASSQFGRLLLPIPYLFAAESLGTLSASFP